MVQAATNQDTPPRVKLSVGQVSWLAGHRLPLAFPVHLHQWLFSEKFTAHSCGGSLGFGSNEPTEFPLSSPLR